ncbi:hypothetical protein AGDE_15987 [Angomonas deanei]|uniref:Uncharacterized protein n=1 Tax=Angomonas deanei TaxID=59799 RepID=A0A7G2CI79_9TRYP|nr:hypothetical protein AGDE_15987 [Angomonas deanei]CAD2219065.1 hypothetical protein, conserved [Angomonas deanei]|eukprot:EPY17975.1 hypothetical protein AGDE_15987 [Angomonas deanei]
MNALGQKLDGVMWEADVRAAKEAVDASHFDHTTGQTVHRFVHRVQDSVAHSGEMGQIFAKFRTKQTTTLDNRRWDCRNEDPRARGTYDIEVIEAALGIVEHKGTGERILQRQWTGQVFERESTAVLIFFSYNGVRQAELVRHGGRFQCRLCTRVAAVALLSQAGLYFVALCSIIYPYLLRISRFYPFCRTFCVLCGVCDC